MSKPSAIRAGRAYVEAYLDNSKLEKQLGGLRDRFKNFSRQVAAVGGVMTGMGTAILGPLAASVKIATEAGSQYAKMSSRTGESVENLSALGYAAQRSGIEIDDMVGSIEELNIRLGETIRDGTGPAAEAFKKLGLDAQKLSNMTPVERFQAIAEKLSQIQNEAERGFLSDEIFGGDAFKMLPLINQGADGIQRLLKEAEKLGYVLSEKDAKAAAEMGVELTKLKASGTMLAITIGQGLIPHAMELVNQIREGVPAVREWVSENQQLILTLAKAGALLTVTGGSLLGVAASASALSTALGVARVTSGFLIKNLSMLGKAGAAGIAVAGILYVAQQVYNLNKDVQELNRSLAKGRELDSALNQRVEKSNTDTRDRLQGIEGPEQKGLIANEIASAEKQLRDYNQQLRNQQKIVNDLEPTWRGLGVVGRDKWREELQNLDGINERIALQKSHIEQLQDMQKQANKEQKTAEIETKRDVDQINGLLKQLNEELKTFGMDAGQKALQTLRDLNATPEELAAAQKSIDDLAAKKETAEAEQLAKDEQARKDQEAQQAEDSIESMLDSLFNQVEDLKLPEEDRERSALLRQLNDLGASETQIREALALLEEKARLSGSKVAEMDSPTAQGGTFSSLSSLIFDGRSKEVTAGEKEIIAAIGKGAEKTTTAVKEGFTFSS